MLIFTLEGFSIASVGFSLSTIDTKVKSTEVHNLQGQAIIDNINSNEAEINKLEPVKETTNSNSEAYRLTSQRIDALQKVDRGLFEQLKDFSEVKVNIQKDVYDTLGKALRIDGGLIKLYMLLVISSLIELALLVTSWDIRIDQGVSIPETETEFETNEVKADIGLVTHDPEKHKTQTQYKTQNEKLSNDGKKICPICKKLFPYKHEDKIFCSSNCRVKSYRAKPK